MQLNVNDIETWCYANLDRIEELLQNGQKAVILVAGASSSGKSFACKALKEILLQNNIKSYTLSTDDYGKGISGIITNKVNENCFENKLANVKEIIGIIKTVITDSDFTEKFSENNLQIIKEKCKDLISPIEMQVFLNGLKDEFSRINFDEPSVYDLPYLANNITTLLNGGDIYKHSYSMIVSENKTDYSNIIKGKDFDVIIVEGLYALNPLLTDSLPKDNIIKNFVECNDKTLFLRRVIRDALRTTADNCFTVKNYLKYVVPGYCSTVKPTKVNADFVLQNNMTFNELRKGQSHTEQSKIKIENKKLLGSIFSGCKIVSMQFQKDLYFDSLNNENANNDNILRVRCLSNDGGKTYELSSMLHKGHIKTRSDGKINRPINLLIKEGDFNKIYSNEQDLIQDFLSAGLYVSKCIIKKRTKIMLDNQEFTLDAVINQGKQMLYVEYETENNSNIVNQLNNMGKHCGTMYSEIETDKSNQNDR